MILPLDVTRIVIHLFSGTHAVAGPLRPRSYPPYFRPMRSVSSLPDEWFGRLRQQPIPSMLHAVFPCIRAHSVIGERHDDRLSLLFHVNDNLTSSTASSRASSTAVNASCRSFGEASTEWTDPHAAANNLLLRFEHA